MSAKAIHRLTQWTMCRATGVISKEPQVISGNGALHRIPEMLKSSGVKSVLVATTSGFIKRGSLEGFFGELEDAGVKMILFSRVVPDPTIECVEEMVTEYVLGNCSAIVAIGGGSVIDCAKAAGARIVRPDKTIRDMKGLLKIRKALPDFYAVPTTAGTGSEATAASVVTDTVDGTHYKYAVNDTCLIPKYAVLDPELSVALPPHITAATGMDALTHAVEAYTNRFASGMVKSTALDAIGLIYGNLQGAYENGGDLQARENMLVASYKAGVAFTNNFVGYVHAVAHGIGGLYGVAHGLANAIILPYVLEQYGSAISKQLEEMGRAAGVEGDFIESIRQMNRRMNIPDKIQELRREDFEIIIDRAISEANYTYPVPVIWDRGDLLLLLEKLIAVKC